MKKTKLILIALLFSIFSFGQKFNISKVIINDQNIKMTGTIEITDSKIIILQNDVKSEMEVKIISQLDDYREFIVENPSTDQYQVRFIFNKNPLNSKEWTFFMETKDNFNGNIQSCTYLLKQ
jgi:hypothetical protein